MCQVSENLCPNYNTVVLVLVQSRTGVYSEFGVHRLMTAANVKCLMGSWGYRLLEHSANYQYSRVLELGTLILYE